MELSSSDDSDDDDHNDQDLNAERDTFTGHKITSFRSCADSVLPIIVLVIFPARRDAQQNANDDRDKNEKRPDEKCKTVVKRSRTTHGNDHARKQAKNKKAHSIPSFP